MFICGAILCLTPFARDVVIGVLGSPVAEVTGGGFECCLLFFDCLWSLGASLDDFAGMGKVVAAAGLVTASRLYGSPWVVLGERLGTRM